MKNKVYNYKSLKLWINSKASFGSLEGNGMEWNE
jgi:hypothetical protein